MSTVDMTLIPVFPVTTLIHTAAPVVQGADANTSKVSRGPHALQIEALAVGTTVTIQGRVSPDGAWVDIKAYSSVDTPAVYMFDVRVNFVRAVRAGAGAAIVYAQGA